MGPFKKAEIIYTECQNSASKKTGKKIELIEKWERKENYCEKSCETIFKEGCSIAPGSCSGWHFIQFDGHDETGEGFGRASAGHGAEI